jgi:riboflavin biosynthesis pyrimidine reductase
MRQLFPAAGDVDPADKALFAVLRSLADVVLVGAGTMRAEGYGPARLSDEGGPGIAAQLATAGLLDEVCLTVAPLLAAGEAWRTLDGAALAPPSVLELAHVLEADGHLFLRYRRR